MKLALPHIEGKQRSDKVWKPLVPFLLCSCGMLSGRLKYTRCLQLYFSPCVLLSFLPIQPVLWHLRWVPPTPRRRTVMRLKPPRKQKHHLKPTPPQRWTPSWGHTHPLKVTASPHLPCLQQHPHGEQAPVPDPIKVRHLPHTIIKWLMFNLKSIIQPF